MNALLPLLLVLVQEAPATVPPAQETPRPPSGPVVVINTTLGKIKVALDKGKAPLSVDNFIKYVRAGHYDGTIFHRVIPKFMIQGGGYEAGLAERTQTLRPSIKNEASNGKLNLRGTIAMARTQDPNSATAQFFINVADNAFLDFKPGRGAAGAGYAVFGEVVEGMDVVDAITATPTGPKGMFPKDVPQKTVTIVAIREVGAPAKPAAAKRPPAKPAPAKPKTAPSPHP
jgi:peptidyl-prolyl cis-trans isomerase A (cyclophilin A)/peptidyl-prolyl cis-trans isomerase B (cyclophilin B)